MTDIDIGAMLGTFGEQATPEHFERIATTAEAAGLDAVWVGDHVAFPAEIPDTYPFSPTGEAPFAIDQDVYDCFDVLSFLAGVTDEVALGTNTCIVPYRHPVVLARNALSVEQLTGGRFDFGVAPGWLETEFEVLDVPFEERGSRTDEFLALFERACDEGEFAFDGPHHSFQRTGFYPTPDRDGPPIWVGGRSGASIRRVAEFGDGWTIFWDRPDAVAETRDRITTAWDDFDREGTPEIAVTRATQVDEDPDRDPEKPLVGDAAEVAEDVAAYADGGTTRIVLDFYSRDVDEQCRQIERWGDRVLALL
jgi:probable F420-dependent oxidoreductase